MPVNAVFKRPFDEQVAFFRGKLGNLIPTEKWTDVWKSAHDTGFMVAGAAKADLLSDFAAAVDRAISEGKSLQAFRQDFDAIVEKHGWSYRGEYNWRTRTIYRTNMATSYAAGRLAQLKSGGFQYWMYRHSDSVASPRPLHVSWNGLTLPADDPWWKTHYPPNGWGCQCYVVGVSRAAGERAGGRFEASPNDGTEPDGRPKGIDKGWDYMPGQAVSDTVTAMANKTKQWEYELAKGFMQSLPAKNLDALAIAYRALPSVADDARRYAERALGVRNSAPIGPLIEVQPYKTLGLLTSSDVRRIYDLIGVDVSGFDFALDRSGIRHIMDRHGQAGSELVRGQIAIEPIHFSRLPGVLNDPDSIEAAGRSWRGNLPLLRYSKRVGNEEFVVVLEVRRGRKMLVPDSYYIRKRRSP